MHALTKLAEARPLVIAGMHRSGTSLLSSLFAGAGVHVGSRLIGAARGNDRGHWEDLDFYEFHARALEANGLAPEGFACTGTVRVPAAMRDEAVALVTAKIRAGVLWGWKDPRTCLFLDFWQTLLPGAAYVFVVRSPWEVADSLFRRGDPIFASHPALAVRVWHHYNRRILDFYRAHRSRCVLADLMQVTQDPAAVFTLVRERLGVPVGEPPARFEPPLLVRDGGGRHQELVSALQPEAVTLYDELRHLAGLDDPPSAGSPRADAAAIAELAIEEWSRAAAAAAEIKAAARVAAEAAQAAAEARGMAEARSAEQARSLAEAQAAEQIRALAEAQAAAEARATAEARAAEQARAMAEVRMAEQMRAMAEAQAAAEARAMAEARAAEQAEARLRDVEQQRRAAESQLQELQTLTDELALQVQRMALSAPAAAGEDRQAA